MSWDAIPVELRDRRQWLCWRAEVRDKETTKVPYNALTRRRASSTDPSTWATYEQAREAAGGYDGIGYVFSGDDPYCGIDLDDCTEADGRTHAAATTIIAELDGYAERSPSCRGAHVVVRGELRSARHKTTHTPWGGVFEVYDRGRYFTFTGVNAAGTIRDAQAALDNVVARLLPPPAPQQEPRSNGHEGSVPDDHELLEKIFAAANGPKMRGLYQGDASAYNDDASAADLALCSGMAFWTGPDPDRIDRLFRGSGLMRDKWDTRRGESTYGSQTIELALKGRSEYYGSKGTNHATRERARTWRDEGSSDATLPTTKANDRPLRDVTADALAHIVGANDPPHVFVRGGVLTRVRDDERGQPLIDALDEHATRGLIARTSEFVHSDRNGDRKIAPPKDVVRDLLALGSWPLPALENVTESPVLREDGTVLDDAGYDPPTRLVYRPRIGLRLPSVPDTPTRTAREAALDLLVTDALGDFPFLDDASRAGALALLLTPIVRPLIAGQVPLALLDATKAGTGKGLLAALVAEVATGRPVSLLAAPSREEEWAKTLLSVLMRGATFLLIDEATELASPALAATLTTPIYEGRVLGRSTIVRLPQRATWAAAGNNIKLGGDIARRCYWIRLDARTSRPWRRTGFRHPDLLSWAEAERGRLLAALLTLARSWCAAGRPLAADNVTLGGFQTWSDVLGGILAHAGVSGFLCNLETLYETADEEASEWEAFLGVWHETHGESALTVATLADEIASGSDLRDTLPARLASTLDRPASFRRSLGKALSKREGTRFGDRDLRVERAGKDSRVVSWRVITEHADSAVCGFHGLSTADLRAGARARAHGSRLPETAETAKPQDLAPRCCCADGGQAGQDGRCGRCYGTIEQAPAPVRGVADRESGADR